MYCETEKQGEHNSGGSSTDVHPTPTLTKLRVMVSGKHESYQRSVFINSTDSSMDNTESSSSSSDVDSLFELTLAEHVPLQSTNHHSSSLSKIGNEVVKRSNTDVPEEYNHHYQCDSRQQLIAFRETAAREVHSEYWNQPKRRKTIVTNETSVTMEALSNTAVSETVTYGNVSKGAEEMDDVLYRKYSSQVIVSAHNISTRNKNVDRAQSCSVLETLNKHLFQPEPPEMKTVIYSLPVVDKPELPSIAFGSISVETLAAELLRLGEKDFRLRYALIDCRYPFEYEGGHLKTAVNIFEKGHLESTFFSQNVDEGDRKIPIFYCEFSQKRGPKMAHHLRSVDRTRNELNYPHVDYEEIYLLDCGYSAFWKRGDQGLCEPCSYVSMFDPKHKDELMSHKREEAAADSQRVHFVCTETSRTGRVMRRSVRGAKSFSFRSLWDSEQRKCKSDEGGVGLLALVDADTDLTP